MSIKQDKKGKFKGTLSFRLCFSSLVYILTINTCLDLQKSIFQTQHNQSGIIGGLGHIATHFRNSLNVRLFLFGYLNLSQD